MIKGLSAVSVWSADLNNLLPFYRDVLGLKVSIQSPRFVVLGEAGGPSVGLGTHSDVRGRNADPARHMIGLATDDLAGDYRRLKAAGALEHMDVAWLDNADRKLFWNINTPKDYQVFLSAL